MLTYAKSFGPFVGDLNGVTAGSSLGVSYVNIGGDPQRLSEISALVTVDAETNNLAVSPRWQVSKDRSTWIDMAHGPTNAAPTALATGTAGADAPQSKVYSAPEAVEGFHYARLALEVSGATGTSSDTYSVTYKARERGTARERGE